MAEEESELELNRFEEEIQNLFISSAGDVPAHQSKSYCAKFCELVEAHTSKWQLPLPQLQVLRRALCSFAHGAAYFPSDCEHVQYTLSSLALSVYELLLFFGKDEFPENPLKDILDCIQDCHSYLVRYQNVYLLQVRQIIKEGGPWANPVLQGILKESEQPGEEDRYLSSEVAQFFELRVRYLMAYERIPEAMALSKGCSQHPSIGRHTFFQQAYLTCLWKASHYNQLFEEIAEIDGKEAVELICNLENDEKDEMLLALSRGFVSQQLANGDMYYMWDLVFIWSKLHLRLKPSKQDFLEECHQLIITATNVKSIFPFMKVILSELGENGLKFCVELCIRALQTDHQNDPANKSLIYKFIAYLLPKDLEICRACALLVFFLERTVESYKTVYLLYNHPDQEYHVEASPVGNSIRFDVLQILKKDLYFDPEFWNMINLRTNCLQLMSGQLENSALTEIMDEKWVPNYCVKDPCKCHFDLPDDLINEVTVICDTEVKVASTVINQDKNEDSSSAQPPVKRRGRKPGSKLIKAPVGHPVRRSFRQLDIAQENIARRLTNRHQRMLTRKIDKSTMKRRGRKPRWMLLEESQAENSAPRHDSKPERKPQQRPSEMKTYERVSADRAAKNNVLLKNTDSLNAPVDHVSDGKPVVSQVPDAMLEISHPDNEVIYITDENSPPASEDSSDSNLMLIQKPSKPSLLPQVSDSDFHMWMESDVQGFIHDQDVLSIIRQFHNYCKSCEVLEIVKDCESADNTVLEKDAENDRSSETTDKPVEKSEITSVVEMDLEVTTSTLITEESLMEVCKPEVGACDQNEESKFEGIETLEIRPMLENSDQNEKDDLDVNDDNIGVAEDSEASPHIDALPDETNVSAENTEVNVKEAEGCLSSNQVSLQDESIAPATEEVQALVQEPLATEVQAPSQITDDVPVEDAVQVPAQTPETIHKPEETSHVLEEVPKNSLEPPEIMSPKTSQEVTIFTHRCRLCDKVFKGGNVRRHALAHFRSDKCMFCDKPPTNLAAAVKHFNVHIQQLKKNKPVDEVQIPSSSSGLERKEMTPQVRDSNTKKPAKESKKPKVEPLLQAIRRHVQKVNGQLKKKQKITPPAEHGPSSEVKSELQEKSEHKEHVFEKEGIVDQMPLDPKDTPEKDEESQAAGNTDSLKALEKVKTVVQTSLEEKRSSVGGETVPCPFEGCERPLFSRGVSILDHLLQEHPNDLKCFKLAFRYGEGKCAFCLRKFNSFRHYLDHMDRHKDLLRHHCPHHRCTERFRTLVQLRDHMKVHPNLVLHCCFTGCSQTFGQMMDLQRHERRHYSCNGMAILATNGEVKKKTGALQTPPEHLQQPALVARLPEPITANCADEDSSNHTGAKEKSSLGMVTGSEASSKVQKNVVNGHSGSKDGTPTKLVKEQDDPSQGAKGSKPFVRPSPCAYLDERFISMPKRRKSHNSNSNSNSHFPSAAQTSESSGASQRRHCPKCFITFASDEELQAHLTLKKCTSFFGFDSDDEGGF
ncbi:uncharacterized protein znf654 isoform X2 [Denticeps clupeoides]|uniref:uncharacterized protein znf654 isoform X2 n=1 Tax=Denticeps clupeoides TaxID=299321 RepID=UPI0010A35D33|nr:zinc finger protein 654 isoform X2 [Denticeps clupeoides]